ncbi:cupin domain-containing protein [Candidatus Magnetominusculus xianensis]|uniref:Cupin n=1 Tax=Candidatus Magnetominusculus xianensis TaxID=1748249 RepID=A0ABR5SE42_9BACT|nr:cupin domain-containing protein [Candidatus Magnetominusculus xianensis]KWT84009.1 putative cupin [Candidatus Magnetominusculus xianensis]MBF0405385.1 cupin domain-containing protein [Nitrospirota bacterium]
MEIKIVKPAAEDLKTRGVEHWPIWQKEASVFDWHYGDTEECYILEGQVTVSTKDGKKVEFGKGDFVTFPKGLSCTWEIKEPIKKHYNFK